MITDYSSSMFDFTLLDKHMIFFTYDIEEYCDKLRGLYVDFRNEAPGPLCMTSEEVIHAIENIDSEMFKCRERILAFKSKYLTYENKNSTENVVKQVFNPNKLRHNMFLFDKRLRKSKVARMLRAVLKRKK